MKCRKYFSSTTEQNIADELMEAMYNEDDADWKCHFCANKWIGIIHNWEGKEWYDCEDGEEYLIEESK